MWSTIKALEWNVVKENTGLLKKINVKKRERIIFSNYKGVVTMEMNIP